MSTSVCIKTSSNETQEVINNENCPCSQCSSSSHLVTVSKQTNKNRKIVTRIVNRLISKTKLKSIDLINNIHNSLSQDQTSNGTSFSKTSISTTTNKHFTIQSFNRNRLVFNPFSRLQQITRFKKFADVKRSNRKPKYNYINFDFSTQEKCINSEALSSNSIQPLPWETNPIKKSKNRDSIRKTDITIKKKENKYLNSLLKIKNQNCITKSDLSNKIKLSEKQNSSGSELKSFLLNDNNFNIKLEPSISKNTIKKSDEIITSVNNAISETNANEKQQQRYTEIIKRVLKMKKSL